MGVVLVAAVDVVVAVVSEDDCDDEKVVLFPVDGCWVDELIDGEVVVEVDGIVVLEYLRDAISVDLGNAFTSPNEVSDIVLTLAVSTVARKIS